MASKIGLCLGLLTTAVIVAAVAFPTGSLMESESPRSLGMAPKAVEASVEARQAPVARPPKAKQAPVVTTPSTPSTPSAVPSVASSARPRPVASSDRLRGESGLLAGKDVDAAAVSAALRSDQRFEEVLDTMVRDMEWDQDAASLAEVYSETIRLQLAGVDGIQLDRIACGLRLCAASFDDAGGTAWDEWRQRFDADPETPHAVFVEREVNLGNGLMRRRVIFSTDPSSSGVLAPAHPGG